MTEEAHKPTPGVTWVRMVRTLRSSDAPLYFASNVSLDASVLDRTSRGINAVRAYFVAASSLYNSLRFTNETVTGPRTFLEWEGKAFGKQVAGITIVVRNKSGRIAKIRLYTSPSAAVHPFATALKETIDCQVRAEYGR
jgi:hypothetical protein